MISIFLNVTIGLIFYLNIINVSLSNIQKSYNLLHMIE